MPYKKAKLTMRIEVLNNPWAMLKASRWLVIALGCLGILEANSQDWLKFSDPNGGFGDNPTHESRRFYKCNDSAVTFSCYAGLAVGNIEVGGRAFGGDGTGGGGAGGGTSAGVGEGTVGGNGGGTGGETGGGAGGGNGGGKAGTGGDGPFPFPSATGCTGFEASGDTSGSEKLSSSIYGSQSGGLWGLSIGSGSEGEPVPGLGAEIGTVGSAAHGESGGSSGSDSGGSSDSNEESNNNGDPAGFILGGDNSSGSLGSGKGAAGGLIGSFGAASKDSDGYRGSESEGTSLGGDDASFGIGNSAGSESGDSSNDKYEEGSSNKPGSSGSGSVVVKGAGGGSTDNSGSFSDKSKGSSGSDSEGFNGSEKESNSEGGAVSGSENSTDDTLSSGTVSSSTGGEDESTGDEIRGVSGFDETQKDSKLNLSNILNVFTKFSLPTSLGWLIDYLKSYDITVDNAADEILKVVRMPQEGIYKLIEAIVGKLNNLQASALIDVFGDSGVVFDLLNAGNKSISCVMDSSRDLPGKIEKKLIGCPAGTVKTVINTLTAAVDDFRLSVILLNTGFNGLFHCSGMSCLIEKLENLASETVQLGYDILKTVTRAGEIGAAPLQIPVCLTSGVFTGILGELIRFIRDLIDCFRDTHVL